MHVFESRHDGQEVAPLSSARLSELRKPALRDMQVMALFVS